MKIAEVAYAAGEYCDGIKFGHMHFSFGVLCMSVMVMMVGWGVRRAWVEGRFGKAAFDLAQQAG